MTVISDNFDGAWQTYAGHTIHYNQSGARLYCGIHRHVEDEDGNVRLDGSHLVYVGRFPSLRSAQDAASAGPSQKED